MDRRLARFDLNKIAYIRNKMRSLLFLASLVTAAAAVTVKDCSSGNSFFKIQSLSFTPDVPVGGQNGTLHSVYEVPMEISAGTTKYSCALNGLPVYNEQFDLCSQTACPITPGVHDDYSTSEVPAVSGKVSCTIDWRDSAGSQLLCIQTIMNVASEMKQNLRGVRRFKQVYTPVLATSLNPNITCPNVESYDPEATEYQNVEEDAPLSYEPVGFHTHADHAKMSLMILRSGQRTV